MIYSVISQNRPSWFHAWLGVSVGSILQTEKQIWLRSLNFTLSSVTGKVPLQQIRQDSDPPGCNDSIVSVFSSSWTYGVLCAATSSHNETSIQQVVMLSSCEGSYIVQPQLAVNTLSVGQRAPCQTNLYPELESRYTFCWELHRL